MGRGRIWKKEGKKSIIILKVEENVQREERVGVAWKTESRRIRRNKKKYLVIGGGGEEEKREAVGIH